MKLILLASLLAVSPLGFQFLSASGRQGAGEGTAAPVSQGNSIFARSQVPVPGQEIDSPEPTEVTSEVIPIKYALASDIADALRKPAGSSGSHGLGNVTIIADERTNSLNTNRERTEDGWTSSGSNSGNIFNRP